jgi:hypothetical protein
MSTVIKDAAVVNDFKAFHDVHRAISIYSDQGIKGVDSVRSFCVGGSTA